MKILLLSMTCGEGHNSIAKAMQKQFEGEGIESKVVDIFRSDPKRQNFNNKGYLFACKHIPHIYDKIWKKQKARDPELRYSKGVYNNDISHVIDDIEQEIKEYKPNAIVCSHNYASGIVSKLRHFNKIDKNIGLYAILTDFFPHPYWESSIDIDKIFIPYEYALEQLHQKGFRDEQIIEVGVPLKEIFYKQLDKAETRKKLGLENKVTLIITSGGFGIGKNEKIVKMLLDKNLDLQIININGRNEKGKESCDKLIKKYNAKNVFNYGFVTNIDELMSASDIMICRGGCVTISEALCKNLPMVIRENIITNEVENAEVLERENACIRLKKFKDIPNILNDLINNKSRLIEMQNNCKKFVRKDTTKNICKMVIEFENKKNT